MQDAPTAPPHPTVRLFRRTEAAEYVRNTYAFPCSPRWLAKLAVVGGGPAFRKAGRTPLYAQESLDTWALNRIGPVQQSTSDTVRARHEREAGDEERHTDTDEDFLRTVAHSAGSEARRDR